MWSVKCIQAPYFESTNSDVMGLHMKVHQVRCWTAWRYTELFNLSVWPRSEKNLNSTR